MVCFIWYENNKGFKIKKFDNSPSFEDIAMSAPQSVDIVELMNQTALSDRVKHKFNQLVDTDDFVSVSFGNIM